MFAALFSCCVAFVLYLLFAGQISSSECFTGAALALLAGLWQWAFRAAADAAFVFSRDHVKPWRLALAHLYPAAGQVAGVALRAAVSGASPGGAHRHPFRDAHPRQAAERARLATVVLTSSLTPDRFVIRVESGRNQILFHTITTFDRNGGDREWLP